MKYYFFLSFLLVTNPLWTQQPLTPQLLEESAYRFTLTTEHRLKEPAKVEWKELIGDTNYVGLAEIHNSAQLSLFTKAFLGILKEKGFEHFAMEMGPNTAAILQERTMDDSLTEKHIQELNRTYGKKSSTKTPFIFANKVEDAAFISEAAKLNYAFWGLDQEYAGSYEMLLDQIYQNESELNPSITTAYKNAKKAIRKAIFKDKIEGESVFCWYPKNTQITNFFSSITNTRSQKVISDIRTSWNIYCEHVKGGSNQLRANYMKKNFEGYLKKYGRNEKVFIKLGGVHLTRGLSPFKVNDVGNYLVDLANKNGKEFLSIRHLITYRNGKSNVGKSAWKSVDLFLKLGIKEQWTLVDLRPFRALLEKGKISTNEQIAYELKSYDLLLISPDDQYPKINY